MATKTLKPEQYRFPHSNQSTEVTDTMESRNTSREWGSQDNVDPLNLSNASSVFEDTKPWGRRPKRGSRKLLRQDAEERDSRLESGIGSGGSLEFGSVSENGSFDANHNQFPLITLKSSSQDLLRPPDGTAMRQFSQTSSGFGDYEYFRSNSRHESGRELLDIPRSMDRQISQASSGYGEGLENVSSRGRRLRSQFSDMSDGSTSRDWGSQDNEAEDPLNLSNGSSVFGCDNSKPPDVEEERKPVWDEACRALEEKLEQELFTSAVENVSSISELAGLRLQNGLQNLRREDSNNTSKVVGAAEAAGVSTPLILPCNLSDIKLEMSESTGISAEFVSGPPYDENMWRIPVRDAAQPESNGHLDYICHEALEPDANVVTTTRHLEWAHHCGSLVAGSPMMGCPLELADCNEAQCFLGWLDRCFHLSHLSDCNRCVGTLGRVLCHSESCPESHCSMPFCRIVQERRQALGRRLSIEELKGEVSYFGKLSAMEAISSSIHHPPDDKFAHAVPLHVLPLAFLGHYGKYNILLAHLRRAGSSPTQASTVIIKKMPRRDHLLPALQLTRDLDHGCIKRVVDVIEEESHLIVLSDFVPGMTFHEMMVEREGHWSWRDHFSALIDAVNYLHERNILFLNWECENILLRTTPQGLSQGSPCLVITQGSLSLLPRGSRSFQGDEALTKSLSPRIAAPEILTAGEVGFPADIWGLGVLLYQLTRREKPYSNLRHYTWPVAREKILQNKQPPDLKGCDRGYMELLHQALSWQPENRPSLQAFGELFVAARRTQNGP